MSDWQTMTAVDRVYVLPRATVSLFVDPGTGYLGALTWTAKNVENLKVTTAINEVRESSTGVPYPEPHHLGESHQITFDGIWNAAIALTRGTQYILALTFLDASLGTSAGAWVRWYFHKVTVPNIDLISRDGNEFTSSVSLPAAYLTTDTGAGSPVDLAEGDAIC